MLSYYQLVSSVQNRMRRLNSEDFSNFFLCLDILFLTFSQERALQEVRKNVEFFRIFLNFHDFFSLFRGFSCKSFLYSELQSRDRHYKIAHKIPRRTVYVRTRGSTGEKWFYTKNVILRGLKLRGFTQNQRNLH